MSISIQYIIKQSSVWACILKQTLSVVSYITSIIPMSDQLKCKQHCNYCWTLKRETPHHNLSDDEIIIYKQQDNVKRSSPGCLQQLAFVVEKRLVYLSEKWCGRTNKSRITLMPNSMFKICLYTFRFSDFNTNHILYSSGGATFQHGSANATTVFIKLCL